MTTGNLGTDLARWLKATERCVQRAGDAKRAVLRRRFDATIDRVWAACTDRDLLAQWFAGVSGELKVGGSLTFEVGAPYTLTAQVLQCEPPHRLVITWAYPGRVVDEVELRLAADGDDTVLELEHRSSDNSDWWIGAGSGWEYAFVRLSVLLQGNDPAGVSADALDAKLGPLWMAVAVAD
jgi:uncharacterized protein YndB with AHSA1/START domain